MEQLSITQTMLTHRYDLLHQMLHVQRGAENIRNFLSTRLFQAVGGQFEFWFSKSQSPVTNVIYR